MVIGRGISLQHFLFLSRVRLENFVEDRFLRGGESLADLFSDKPGLFPSCRSYRFPKCPHSLLALMQDLIDASALRGCQIKLALQAAGKFKALLWQNWNRRSPGKRIANRHNGAETNGDAPCYDSRAKNNESGENDLPNLHQVLSGEWSGANTALSKSVE